MLKVSDFLDRAALAQAKAANARTTEIKVEYLTIADEWRDLAAYAERAEAQRPEEEKTFHAWNLGILRLPHH